MTLTESHHFINILNDWINDKEKTDKKYSEYFKTKLQNYNKINFSVFETLNKVCCFSKSYILQKYNKNLSIKGKMGSR